MFVSVIRPVGHSCAIYDAYTTGVIITWTAWIDLDSFTQSHKLPDIAKRLHTTIQSMQCPTSSVTERRNHVSSITIR